MGDEVSAGNRYMVCQINDKVVTFGIWLSRNPLNYAVPLILVQLSAISLLSTFIDYCLKPLGQSSIVSQIVGGVLFGPSLLSHNTIMGNALFPVRSRLTMETFASMGLMFFFFAIGIRSDTRLMVRPGKHALIIGIPSTLLTLLFCIALTLILRASVSMEDSLSNALPYIAASQSLTSFPNISCLLAELKMSGSDLGRIAISTALFCELITTVIVVVLMSLLQSDLDPIRSSVSLLSALVFSCVLIFVLRPIIKRAVRRIPSGKSLGEIHVFTCFVGVLVCGFITELMGQHYVFGPLLLGFMVPDGPPLGAAMITKLDLPIGKFLYPTFLTTSGLKTNIYRIDLKSLGIVFFVVFFSILSKIGVVVFSSRFLDIYFHDSVVIGLMLSARGVTELFVYNLWRDGGLLQDQEFALSVVSVIVVTAVITPLIKLLYNPSQHFIPLKRRTIQHCKRDAELRILVCIQNQESVPSIINLLEASNANEHSHIAVIAIVLVELTGRATNMLVAHQSTRTLQPTDSRSSHIINALRQYELCNESCVTIQSFSAVSHLETMNEDICRVSLDQNATVVILPFHKQWEIDGSIASVNRAVQSMNINVLEKAPCSVAILVDRGVLTGSVSILNNQAIYRVAIIYIGGPDDAESLSYGARMANHNNVTLTVIRFLLYGCDTARERKIDNGLIDEVRQANMENQNFVYQEHIVKDGVGLAASLRGIENHYDLLITGRNHQSSPIMMGLGAWSECPELGVVGDVLASPDFGSTASVLVVQQQRFVGGKLKNGAVKPVVVSHEGVHSTTSVDHEGSNWEISVDKDRV